MAATQDKRDAKITTPLGANVLLLQSMNGREQLGRLSEFRLQLLSENSNVAINNILGKPVTISLDAGGGRSRFFHGFVTRFLYTGSRGRFATYEAVMHPWLWFLTRTSDCRIFQDMSVPDIIKKVFNSAEYQGVSDFDAGQLSGTYAARKYCVQYRETDFDFISRLMEEEGIYYYFKHQDGRHTLVLVDNSSAHSNMPGKAALPYRPGGSGVAGGGYSVSEWRVSAQVVSGAYALNDFDFEKSRTSLLAKSTESRGHDQAGYEVYDYPGHYLVTADGSSYARKRLDALQAQHELVSGSTDARQIGSGMLFKLEEHPRGDQNRECLVIRSDYNIDNGDYEGGGNAGGEVFRCSFRAMPKQQTYRSPSVTPKPVMRGPQTAIVVGKSGEEQYVDQYGRVKVQFHWDREGQSDENSSCYIRVSQEWAGKRWGMVFLPRIGQEVIVSFLEGDPDQPIITGRVYNDVNMPPYSLPDEQTKSTIKSNSTKDGTGFNELRFDDKKDSEEIFFHAEKNFNRVVQNDDTLKVGFEKKDPGNRKIEVYNNEDIVIGNNQTVKIGFEIADAGDHKLEIKNDQTVDIGNDQTEKIGNDLSLDVGNNQSIKVGNDQSVEVGNACVIEASTSIELKVGGSSIKIEAAKITIKAPQIAISADGQAEVKAGGMLDLEASGIANLKGSMVKIN